MTKALKYGPQTTEIEQILSKTEDPRNRDADAAAYTAADAIDAADAAAYAADAAAYTAADAILDAAWSVAWEFAWYLRDGIYAVACHHLIGDTFTQEHYDTLYEPLRVFLYLVDNTEPGSAERELACGLTETLGVEEAVNTAKLILKEEWNVTT